MKQLQLFPSMAPSMLFLLLLLLFRPAAGQLIYVPSSVFQSCTPIFTQNSSTACMALLDRPSTYLRTPTTTRWPSHNHIPASTTTQWFSQGTSLSTGPSTAHLTFQSWAIPALSTISFWTSTTIALLLCCNFPCCWSALMAWGWLRLLL